MSGLASHAHTLIIGAGLSGLHAAHLLEQRGAGDYTLLEGRDRPGGRILSANSYDLGPAWLWPEVQPELAALVGDLGLSLEPQHETGLMMVERSGAPLRMPSYASYPASMRVAGGMETLTDALRARLDPARIRLNQTVTRLHAVGDGIEAHTRDPHGRVSVHRASRILLAVPPRLAQASIDFDPPLPAALAAQWRDTPTWMAPHAKYVAIYATPFWREQGLSGEARSGQGPMAEIHDAGTDQGPSLFGFLGVPAAARLSAGKEILMAHCRAQLARLFGPQALTPVREYFKDWAQDPHTATQADGIAGGAHAAAPAMSADTGPWQGRVAGIASEWSAAFPGYLAGAADAAGRGVQWLLQAPPAYPPGNFVP